MYPLFLRGDIVNSKKSAVEKAHEMLRRLRQEKIGIAVFSGAKEGKVEKSFLQRKLESLSLEDQATLLQKEVEILLDLTEKPSLAALLKAKLPLEIAKEVAEHMFQIYVIGQIIKEVGMSEVLQNSFVRTQSGFLAFYKEEYEPNMENVLSFLLNALYSHSPAEGKTVNRHFLRYLTERHAPEMLHIFTNGGNENPDEILLEADVVAKLFATIGAGYRSKIKNVFRAMISMLEESCDNATSEFVQHGNEKISKSSYFHAADLVYSDYFRPDDWLQNIADIGQVLSPQHEEDFPVPVRIRVREMHESFVFGNWMGVVVLGRSLLEYMIVDRKHVLKIDPYEKNRQGWIKGIGDLVKSAVKSELAKPLAKDMEKIVEYGNRVMHPVGARASSLQAVCREDALACMKTTIKVIQTLYDD